MPEADIVSQGTDFSTKSLGEAGRKLLGWTAHPRAPRRRRGMEKRGTSLAWPPLGPPPLERSAGRTQAPQGLVFSKPWCLHLSNGVMKLAVRMRSELNETEARTGLDTEHTGFFYAR